MTVIADIEALVREGIISPEAAAIIRQRARAAMMMLVTNTVLSGGIIAAALGTVFWLGDAMAVAVLGLALLGLGMPILLRGGENWRIFGNAAMLIGAGMLLGGGSLKLIELAYESAGQIMFPLGALVAGLALAARNRPNRFVAGSVFLIGVAMHLAGLGLMVDRFAITGVPRAGVHLYAALVLAAAGWAVDIRFVTALAIVPFAQMLDTSTFYEHALYAFYSPEPTLSILQMTVLLLAALWAVSRLNERSARHLRAVALMGFIVANLCALVGSLWGDSVGLTLFGPHYDWSAPDANYEAYEQAQAAFIASSVTISAEVYSVLWAVALAALAFWAAGTHRRALFNTSLTFGAIHAYTQLFESFGAEPLAFAIGGFAAIPLAWGMWKLNQRFETQA